MFTQAVPFQERAHILLFCRKRYVPQFSNMTCTKHENIMLRIFTNSIDTLTRVWHVLHIAAFSDFVVLIIYFIFVNYILCVRVDLVKIRVTGMSSSLSASRNRSPTMRISAKN
jgi:hypothetical protein